MILILFLVIEIMKNSNLKDGNNIMSDNFSNEFKGALSGAT